MNTQILLSIAHSLKGKFCMHFASYRIEAEVGLVNPQSLKGMKVVLKVELKLPDVWNVNDTIVSHKSLRCLFRMLLFEEKLWKKTHRGQIVNSHPSNTEKMSWIHHRLHTSYHNKAYHTPFLQLDWICCRNFHRSTDRNCVMLRYWSLETCKCPRMRQ